MMRYLVALRTYLNVFSNIKGIRLWAIGNCPKLDVRVPIVFVEAITSMYELCTVEYGDFVQASKQHANMPLFDANASIFCWW